MLQQTAAGQTATMDALDHVRICTKMPGLLVASLIYLFDSVSND